MDPLSALILAGIMSSLVAHTAGSAVTDTIAQARGHTPPSLEKWRARQQKQSRRGSEVEPGPWARRWNNAVERRNAKAAQKHEAKLEHLRDLGPDRVAKYKQRLQRRAQRREAIGARVAGWGSSSWQAAKQAAEQTSEAASKRRGWRENQRRNHQPDGEAQDDVAGLAPVVPLPRRGQEPSPYNDEELSTADLAEMGFFCQQGMDLGDPCGNPKYGDTGVCWEHLHPKFKGGKTGKSTGTGGNTGTLSPEQQALVDRWRSELANSNGQPTFGWFSTEEWYSLPEWARNQMIDEARDAGYAITPRTDSGQIAEVGDSRMDPRYGWIRITETSDGQVKIQTGHDVEGNTNIYGNVLDPSTWQGTDRHGRDIQTGIGPSRDATKPGGIPSVVHNTDLDGIARDTSPERKAVTRHRKGLQEYAPNNDEIIDNTQDGDTMDTNLTATTEITDLDTAIAFSQETARYTDTVTSALTDITAQLEAAIRGLQAEASAYEGAGATLGGQGFGEKVTGRFAIGQEALHTAAEAVRTALEQVTTASEQVTAAGGEMRTATQVFNDQLAIQEQLGAAQQDAGVASRTDFYTGV